MRSVDTAPFMGRPNATRACSWKPNGALGPDGIVIPRNIITKLPTAELRENQKDQDSLPPYDVLDGILERLVELEQPIADIVRRYALTEVVKAPL